MNVYCCYTPAHELLLRDYFLPSLPNDVRLHARRLDIGGNGDFLSAEFLHCINRKLELIEESLRQNDGSIIVWTDIDIVFFESFKDRVIDVLEENSLDIAFQVEGYGQWADEVNTGFFVCRCNDKVRRFFERVRKAMAQQPDRNEQPIVNDLLQVEWELKWGFLPYAFSARSHGFPPPPDAVMYHANCTPGKDGVGQKLAQFSELCGGRGVAKRRICIVTPELEGPRRNSGIGIHTLHLARLLACEPETEVTVLLTSEVTNNTKEFWRDRYQQQEVVRLEFLDDKPHLYPDVGWFNQWFSLRSQQVYAWLRGQSFTVVHFQDLGGDGFFSVQARRTGVAFQKCVFTCMVNGPEEWAREGMKRFPASETDEALQSFMESYVLKHADLVLGPSRYALDWCVKSGWELGKEEEYVPTCLSSPEHLFSGNGKMHRPLECLVFFGRLETRKGLPLFLNALELLYRIEAEERAPRSIVFLGKHGRMPSGSSQSAIRDFFNCGNGLPQDIEYVIHSDWDHGKCMDYLAWLENALIVLPSVAETMGYTLLECLELKANFIASDIEVFREICATRERLFELNPRALASKMREAIVSDLPSPVSRYSPDKSREAWAALHNESLRISDRKIEGVLGDLPRRGSLPLVSVCVPHYNYGDYLSVQLESLSRQTYPAYEVIVIDDGSTAPRSRALWNALRVCYEGDRFRFYEQSNHGISHTRNRAAAHAKGEYLLFADADNISKPEMITAFVKAMEFSGADCLTCHMEKFALNSSTGEKSPMDSYTPVGSCIEVGPFVNPYGDANFIIRKDVFQKLKGFRHVPHTSMEDWEFLGELAAEGFSLDVVPAQLFAYRNHSLSNIRQTSFYDSRIRTLEPYLKRMEPWQRRMLINCVGAYHSKITALMEAAPPEVMEAAPPEVMEAAPPEVMEAAPPEVMEAAPPEVMEAAPPEVMEAAPPEVMEAAPPEVMEAAPSTEAVGTETAPSAEEAPVETAPSIEEAPMETAPFGEAANMANAPSWRRTMSYQQYDSAYQVWKKYRNKGIDKDEALRLIRNLYGIGPFFLLYPLYKLIKPVVKLKNFLS